MNVTQLSANAAKHPAADDTLYGQVAARISGLIECGTLRPGERVPSVRRYSRQESVSIATVMQAYRLLESRGWIEARPQSGYYVRMRRWSPPPEVEIYRPKPAAINVRGSDLMMQVVRAGRIPDMVRLGSTVPGGELLPARELNRIAAAIGRRSPHTVNAYAPPPGDLGLRQQIAQRAMQSGCTLSPEDIIVTCGTTEALNLSLRAVTKPGDIVAIESPTFGGILQTIESLGLRVCEVPTYPREGICLDELAKRLRFCRIKACLFTPNGSNPLGSVMPEEKKQRLVQMLAAREIPLIEDDVYGNLTFNPTRPRVAKAYDKEGWVLTCDSFSKTLSPGSRVGWVVPGRFKARVEFLKLVSSSATTTLTQLALAEYLRAGGYDRHLRTLRRVCAENVQRMTEAIGRHFPEGTRVTRPLGGLALWVELPEHIQALEVHELALKEKISISPGPLFSAKQGFQNFIRLGAGNPWSEEIERAMVKLGQIIAKLDALGARRRGSEPEALAAA